MPALIALLLVLHVVPGVYWAGSTFVLAQARGAGADRLFRSQMIAATVAVLAGIVLWGLLHAGPNGPVERTLGIGAVCAVVAAGVQGGMRKSPATSQRIAAALLAITVICMVVAKYTV